MTSTNFRACPTGIVMFSVTTPVHVQRDAAPDNVLEPLQIEAQRVRAHGQIREHVISTLIADRILRDSSGIVGGGHLYPDKNRSTSVGNQAERSHPAGAP